MSDRETGAAPDTIDIVAGLAPGGAVAALRRARAKVDLHTRGSEAALFDPALAERLHAARQAAALSRATGLAEVYRQRLLGVAGAVAIADIAAIDSGDAPALPPRLAAIATHVRRLVAAPADASPADLEALRAAGLSTAAIVALSQLVAFVTYQWRVIAVSAALDARLAQESA
ncbi:hypothetical protein [Burkholderia gladioli]|uniref:hypothetical protein n=1 Tax=Burkholderia gladioli TaxID=28095 RepID=UPI00163EF311|nr:hypothetical protein [Burkholderia gladioli]